MVVLRSSGEDMAAKVRWLRHRYAIVFGANRGCVVRRDSRVQCRVGVSAHELVAAVRTMRRVDAAGASLAIHGRELRYDEIEHLHLVPARLHLPWAWPDLPMWLTVATYAGDLSVLGLLLRSHARIRYPARYFHGAHLALGAVRDAAIADRRSDASRPWLARTPA